MSLSSRHSRRRFTALLAALALLMPLPVLANSCPAPGEWRLADGSSISNAVLMRELADQQVVLLGEQHDRLAHHRWQLQTLSGLYAHRDELVIGLEMLPRSAQPALDAWVAGELSEARFLEESGWHKSWGFDPALYLPILHFARMQQIPLLALNIDAELRQRLASDGWDSVPEDERYAISAPLAPSQDYRERLEEVYAQHPSGNAADAARFIAAQVVWDRAMAQALADALNGSGSEDTGRPPLVVGLIGQGHLTYGHGVPHQLADLGVSDQRTLLPWPADEACEAPATLADALYTLSDETAFEPSAPPQLGVMIEAHNDGVLIQAVGDDSIAARAGLSVGDIIMEAAGRPLSSPGELVAVIRHQAPGTLLPLAISRDGNHQDVLAHFPPLP